MLLSFCNGHYVRIKKKRKITNNIAFRVKTLRLKYKGVVRRVYLFGRTSHGSTYIILTKLSIKKVFLVALDTTAIP